MGPPVALAKEQHGAMVNMVVMEWAGSPYLPEKA